MVIVVVGVVGALLVAHSAEGSPALTADAAPPLVLPATSADLGTVLAARSHFSDDAVLYGGCSVLIVRWILAAGLIGPRFRSGRLELSDPPALK